ncbi:MAG: HAMP domain-containing sensor histidine kinase, partial [Proteobacteria bacterium]|nr:HAMP domain-containing sensor histidine kinase [Pseudomonadota bacterium]
INGNPPRLCQVSINLIKNAIDAIGDKEGSITIETSNEYYPSSTSHTHGEGGKMLICKITDNGEGIDKKVLKDIFKPFFTTKKQGMGIGLGLFIVHEIIKDHEGLIEVESDTTHGTTFTLIFPCHVQ